MSVGFRKMQSVCKLIHKNNSQSRYPSKIERRETIVCECVLCTFLIEIVYQVHVSDAEDDDFVFAYLAAQTIDTHVPETGYEGEKRRHVHSHINTSGLRRPIQYDRTAAPIGLLASVHKTQNRFV